jgi:tetratricopeptide (TPR) repeat protein
LQRAANAKVEFSEQGEARARLAVLTIDPAASNAQAELEAITKSRPNDPAALTRLAEVHRLAGRLDEAIAIYEKTLGTFPALPTAVRPLALLLSRRAPNDPKTFGLLQNARQSYPQDVEIAKALGIATFHRGFYPRAIELFQEALTKKTEDSEIFYYLGQAHFQIKQWPQCRSNLERALSTNVDDKLSDNAKGTIARCNEAMESAQ